MRQWTQPVQIGGAIMARGVGDGVTLSSDLASMRVFQMVWHYEGTGTFLQRDSRGGGDI